MNEEKRKDGNRLTLSLGTLIKYSLGGMFPNGWILLLNGYYMMPFMTDIIKMPTILAATVYSAIQWWKLAAMIISGLLIDGVHLKSGKYRGWVRIALWVEALVFPLAYADLGLDSGTAAVVVIVAQMIVLLGYNVSWTGIRTLPAAMARTSMDVNCLTAASAVGGSLSTLIWGAIGTAMLSVPLWAGTTNAYCGVAALCSLTMILGGIIMFRLAEPYDNGEKQLEGSKRERIDFKSLLGNLKGPMIPYFISATLSSAQSGFFSTLLTYYSTNILKNPSVTALVLSLQSVISLVGNFVAPYFTKFISKKTAHIVTQYLYAACYIIIGIFGTNTNVFVGVRALMSCVGTISSVVGYAFPIDIGDYNEMHGIKASRGILTAVGGTTTRLGHAASTTIAAFGLAAIGYTEGCTFDAEMCDRLVRLMVVGPTALALLSGTAMLFYRVDEKAVDEYRARKNTAKAEAAEEGA